MESFESQDPYHILAVSPSASEAEISKAFHDKLRTAKREEEREKILHAYGLISNQAARERFKWDEVGSLLYELPKSQDMLSSDLEALVRELAFLTPWELGDDACLK